MAVFAAIVLTAFLFEDDDLVVFFLVEHGGLDACARNCRRTDFSAAGAADEQNMVERDRAALGCVEQLDFNDVVFRDAILLTTGFNDCVHDNITVYFQVFSGVFRAKMRKYTCKTDYVKNFQTLFSALAKVP